MQLKLVVITVTGALLLLLLVAGFTLFSQEQSPKEQQLSNEITKLDIPSLFNVYGFGENFEMKDGKKSWNNVKFELNPENNKIYEELNHDPSESVVVIFPIFTAAAYAEPGFYTYFRGECDKQCLTAKIPEKYVPAATSSGNGIQVLELLGYSIISDIVVDQNPDTLEKYDKVILLHNEYVTKKEFDAITNHPNVIYLYPNALYAEVEFNEDENTITMIRGHNYPETHIVNGFDWKFDNSILEYDLDCKDMGFDKIENGWILNCYPEKPIHQSKILLKMIKEF